MILKDKNLSNSLDVRSMAGEAQERDVAFYLRRAFKDRDDTLVINDLRIEYNDEVAQIDHLVITDLGFCLIESKSIKATVNINEQGEWSRSYKGSQKGIPSPIKQVELQQKLLKDLLKDNIDKLLGKVLGLQKQLGGRRWLSICAVSSDAVIDRTYLPKDLNNRIMKSEFIADWVEKNVCSKRGMAKALEKVLSSEVRFSPEELSAIGEFLVSQHRPLKASASSLEEDIPPKSAKQSAAVDSAPEQTKQESTNQKKNTIKCKGCGSESTLTAAYGKYGYYVKCSCGTTTSMKTKCPSCDSNMKVQKSKETYTANCECGESFKVFTSQG